MARPGPKPTPFEGRFWAKVDKTPGQGPWGDCWTWTGSRNERGYGQFRVGPRGSRLWRAHVLAFVLANGPMPADKPCGLHHCDNPPCCNPAHTFPGTQAQNIADMVAKGRQAFWGGGGGAHSRAKLDWPGVERVRARLAAGETTRSVARDLGMHHTTISAIGRNKIWASA